MTDQSAVQPTESPFDQDVAEPPELPPPAWLAEGGPLESLDRPSTGVVHDVIGEPARVSAAPAAPVSPAPPVAPVAPPPERDLTGVEAPVLEAAAAMAASGDDATGTELNAPPNAQPVPMATALPKEPSKRQAARANSRARMVRRTVRHVDPWSVLKLSLLFYTCMLLVLLVAGIILWVIAASVGAIGNIENFFGSLGYKDFHFLGSRILEGTILGGLVLVAIASAFTVLLTVFFNLIADIVGGVELTVVEHDADRPVI